MPGRIYKATKVLDSQLVVSLTAYSSGDNVGGKLTFSNAVQRMFKAGLLAGVLLQDNDSKGVDMDLVIFNDDPSATTFTDNAALDIADADIAKIAAVVPIRNHMAFADNGVSYAFGQMLPIAKASDSVDQSLYGALIVRGTPTYAATTDLRLLLQMLQD